MRAAIRAAISGDVPMGHVRGLGGLEDSFSIGCVLKILLSTSHGSDGTDMLLL